jgi:hypothetical protein
MLFTITENHVRHAIYCVFGWCGDPRHASLSDRIDLLRDAAESGLVDPELPHAVGSVALDGLAWDASPMLTTAGGCR